MRKAFTFYWSFRIFHLLIFTILFSCNETRTESPAALNLMNTGGLKTNRATNILFSRSVQHIFSDTSKQDTFRLTLTGGTVLNGEARFDIIDFNGQPLYTETFPAVYLLGFADDQNDTPKQKENFIINRANTFFDEGNFSKPAIRASELFDADYSDKFNWVTIKAEPDAIAFNFLIGEENHRKIAYSRKYKKVLLIFSCC